MNLVLEFSDDIKLGGIRTRRGNSRRKRASQTTSTNFGSLKDNFYVPLPVFGSLLRQSF